MKEKSVLLIAIVFSLCFCLLECKQEAGDPSSVGGESLKPLAVHPSSAAEVASSYTDFHRYGGIAGKNLRMGAAMDNNFKRVKEIRTLKDDTGEDLMHVIDYVGENNENRGFIIIAADRRVTPILARGDSGTFDLGNPGVQVWISHVMDQVRQGKRDLTKPEKDIEALWRDFERRADIKAGRITGAADPQLPPGRNCPDDWQAFVPPIL